MKKIFCLFFFFINILTFSENIYEEIYQLANENNTGKMYSYYYCPIENMNLLEKCEHENAIKIILYNDYVFEKEFENNEQRAINILKEKNSLFFCCGKIAKLSSGIFNLAYVIEFENGVTVYLGEQFLNNENPLEFTLTDEQKKMYLNLNKGDYACIISKEFLMNIHTGKTFMKSGILDENGIQRILKDIKTVKQHTNK